MAPGLQELDERDRQPDDPGDFEGADGGECVKGGRRHGSLMSAYALRRPTILISEN